MSDVGRVRGFRAVLRFLGAVGTSVVGVFAGVNATRGGQVALTLRGAGVQRNLMTRLWVNVVISVAVLIAFSLLTRRVTRRLSTAARTTAIVVGALLGGFLWIFLAPLL